MKWNLPCMQTVLKALSYAVFAALAVWGMGIVFFCLKLGWIGLAVYVLLLGCALYFRKQICVKWIAAAIVAGLTVYYLCIPPSNERNWQPSWSQSASGTVSGDTLVIQNVRDFRYRTPEDFDVRYATKTYDLKKLESLDFAVSHWDGIKAVSHTLLSFGFSDGQHLALSAETRLDETDTQGAVAGLFKRFELQFIFSTEEDIFALRTNYRHEDLYLYRVQIDDPAKIKAVLLDFVNRANESLVKPQFYNTVTNNCTTALRPSLKKFMDNSPSRWNAISILNGYVDQKAFDRGWLKHRPGETFDVLHRRSLVPHDTAKNDPSEYSRKIREATIFSKK